MNILKNVSLYGIIMSLCALRSLGGRENFIVLL